ncbi:MAG: ytiB [Bacilli bacterium]|nr:ytiB [Bacilli bacterium]
MSKITEILEYNQAFVDNKEYEQYRSNKFPDKRLVILTCMDARLVELLPKALNLKNGDAKIIKNAGAVLSHPFGSVMRSILVAIYELNADEILVIGHHDCGMTGLNSTLLLDKAIARGVSQTVMSTLGHSGIDLHRWLTGFNHVQDAVVKSVGIIKNHPLLPSDILVHGLIMDPETGKLEVVETE